jgi:D-2-hydroxyacid dehydrogenase (NADP+)
MSQPSDLPAPEKTKLFMPAHYKFPPWRPPVEMAERIRERWPAMRVSRTVESAVFEAELAEADIFFGVAIRPEQYRIAKRLRWIQATSAGVNQFLCLELRESGIVLTNASGVHSAPIAEHVVGMLVALSRDFPAQMRYQLAHKWSQREIAASPRSPRELQGKIALLVGFGAIGRAVAERVRAFGMHVWAVTRSGAADPALADRCFSTARLLEALPSADFVIVAVPDTPDTHQFLRAEHFAAMKPTAFFLNIARGTVVDEPALIAALARGTIAGAALDVAAEEPLPPESPLWSLENVIVTPHTSGISERMWEREEALLMENLERWFAGRELKNRVDVSLGY